MNSENSPAKRGIAEEAEHIVFRSLIAALALGSIAALIFMLSYPGQESSSAVYFAHDSWTGYLSGKEAKFTYGIENYEGMDVNYDVKFFAAGNLIEQEHIFVKKDGKVERAKTISLEQAPEKYPFKIRIVASPLQGRGQSAFFWIKGAN